MDKVDSTMMLKENYPKERITMEPRMPMHGCRQSLMFVALMLLAILTCAQPSYAMYAPAMGRFMQKDPLGYVDGMNHYQYVKSGPTLYRDYSGLSGKETILAKSYTAYVEWLPEQGVAELKVLKNGVELARYRWDKISKMVQPILVHGGRQLPGISRECA